MITKSLSLNLSCLLMSHSAWLENQRALMLVDEAGVGLAEGVVVRLEAGVAPVPGVAGVPV